MNPILKILCATLFACAITGCTGLLFGGMNSLSGDARLRTTTGVAFDPAHSLELDVFAPQDARAAPVVVFFYGGYWRNGERRQYRWVGEALARVGVVVVLPDYTTPKTSPARSRPPASKRRCASTRSSSTSAYCSRCRAASPGMRR